MKIISITILSIVLSLFVNFAYTQNNVNSLLISGDTKQLRQAAMLMTKEQQNTPENLHLLASIIEQEFESAPSNRIDALSWGCRALGETGNGQYKSLLQQIYKSKKAHKKLKKYAKKAYHKLVSKEKMVTENKENFSTEDNTNKVTKILNLPINIESLELIPKASLTESERKMFAIARGEWQAIKHITLQLEVIETIEDSEVKLLDALSQFLFEMHIYNLDDEQIDVLAWICRKLGESNMGRYKPFLQNIAEQVTDKKLYKHATSAANSLSYTASSYIIGSVNFKQILDKYKR